MLGAVISRELATVLRDRRMLFGQVGVAALLALLVALRWPTEAQVALSGARSQEVFNLVCSGLLIILLLLLPVFPATSIVREKKQGTLALLLNTPLGAWRIFTGKLASVLGLAGLLLTLSLPATTACYAMGGLSLVTLARVYELFILVALMCSVLGLLVSSYAQSVDAAVRWTYAIVLFVAVLSQGPHYFFQGTNGSLADLGELLRGLSPFAALASLLGAGDVGGKGLMSTTDVASQFVKTSLLISCVGSVWTMSRINHKIFDRSRAAGQISNDQNLAVRAFRRLFFLVDPQRRSVGIPPLVNPITVKEFRCRRFGRLHWLLRLVSVCAVLSLGLTYATTAGTVDWGVETIGGLMVMMQVSLIILITPSLSAGLISNERETRGWQLLQTTPLSTTRIVTGKLVSVLLPLMLILCATLPGYIVMVYIEPGMTFQVQRVVVCLIATALFAMCLSSAVGCLFRRTATATAAAYAALLAVCVVPLLIWLGRDAPFGHDTVEAALTINPAAAALSVIRMPGFQNYELIPGNWWFMGTASVLSLLVLLGQTWRISRPQ